MTAPALDGDDAGSAGPFGDGIDPSAAALFHVFAGFLTEHAARYGVVSRRDADRVLERHVLDSARAVGCLPNAARTAVDVGSGAGLPGIPVAICRPDLRVFLLEARKSRVALLEAAVQL